MSDRRSNSTSSFSSLIKRAVHWASIDKSARLPSLWLADGRLIVGSTNGYGASLFYLPADVDGSFACAVERDALSRVKTVRGILALLRRSCNSPSFDLAWLERVINLPARASFWIARAEIDRVASITGTTVFNDVTSFGVHDNSMFANWTKLDVSIDDWRIRKPVYFATSFLHEVFILVASDKARVELKEDGDVPILHARGEGGGFVEHHLLAGMRSEE